MKKFILFFLFFFTFNSAQTYIPLLQNGNVWWEIEVDTSGNSYYSYTKVKYFFQGDLLVSGLIYKKLYRNQYAGTFLNGGGPFNSPYWPLDNPNEFVTYLREDVDGKKIYRLQSPDGEEKLIYDFNLNIGDTIPKNLWDPHNINYTDPNYGVITQITSANIFGRIRKVFKIYYIAGSQGQPDERLYVIEGIGNKTSLLSLPDSDKIFELGSYSECFEDIANGKNCDRNLTLAVKNTEIKLDAQLIYSKTNRDFRILGKEKNYTVYFYDSLGRKIETIDNIGNGNTFRLLNEKRPSIVYYFIKGDQTEKLGKILLP